MHVTAQSKPYAVLYCLIVGRSSGTIADQQCTVISACLPAANSDYIKDMAYMLQTKQHK